jgi:hypothetical protein
MISAKLMVPICMTLPVPRVDWTIYFLALVVGAIGGAIFACAFQTFGGKE